MVVYIYCLRCIKPILDDASRDIFVCIRIIHNVGFSKIRVYLTYALVFEDEHVRSGVVHLVFQSQTLQQLRVFENVRVIIDFYILEEHLNASLIYQTMARMIY